MQAPDSGLSVETRRLGEAAARRAAEFLISQQGEHGGWSASRSGAELPAVTALAGHGLIMQPGLDWRSGPVADAVAFLLGYRQPDGGIYDTLPDGTGVLASYNTAIAVSFLSEIPTADAGAAVEAAVPFIRRLQWTDEPAPNPEAGPESARAVPESHPFFGGWGYGRHGRPDISNTQFALQALDDAGVSPDDPAVQKALVFLRRVQMQDEVNEMDYADGATQGGFIYATVPNAQTTEGPPGQSMAGEIEITGPDGDTRTALRAYGSVSYAGLKSLIYADLDRDDPRVQAVLRWIRRNYTLAENPGMGDQGYYYFLLTHARALDSLDQHVLMLEDADGDPTAAVDWRANLITRIAELQDDDGGLSVRASRWMEDNRTLITAYGLIALQHALARD